MGIFHLSPYDATWAIVLYYICIYGLIITLVLSLNNKCYIDKYDRMENVALMAYMALKMSYHIANLNSSYAEYLYALRSEVWAGVFTFVVLGIMFSFQCINLVKYVKKR